MRWAGGATARWRSLAPMSDFFPPVARGARPVDAVPAPPRPDEDERWEYLADHLRAIRTAATVMAVVVVAQVVGVVLWLVAMAAEGS